MWPFRPHMKVPLAFKMVLRDDHVTKPLFSICPNDADKVKDHMPHDSSFARTSVVTKRSLDDECAFCNSGPSLVLDQWQCEQKQVDWPQCQALQQDF